MKYRRIDDGLLPRPIWGGPLRTVENQFRLSQQLVIFQLTREGKSYAKKKKREKCGGNSHRCATRGSPSLSLDDDNGRENVTVRADAKLVRLSAVLFAKEFWKFSAVSRFYLFYCVLNFMRLSFLLSTFTMAISTINAHFHFHHT